MRRRTRPGLLLGALLCCILAPAAAGAASPFAGWSAAVIAADFKGSNGGDTEAFDNARRDVAVQLTKLGFSPQNILQFSVRPDRYPDTRPQIAALPLIRDGLKETGTRASAGCLIYYTSHGVPGALVLATERRGQISPVALDQTLEAACPGRPSIVVLSACFSGSFIPGLAKNDRMIFTAARPDRTSFGCGESDVYPYFDACFLEQAPGSKHFIDLARRTTACVAVKEQQTGAKPPSEPQLWIGPALSPLLPLYAFPSG
jgi:hypothetical protein